MAKKIYSKIKSGTSRLLLVTADDFGADNGINTGILRCLDFGIVKNIALFPGSEKTLTAEQIKKLKKASIGLHLDVIPLEKDINRISDWLELTTFFWPDKRKIDYELDRLNESFNTLCKMGLKPVFVNGHQHIHIFPLWAKSIANWCQKTGIKYTRRPFEGFSLDACKARMQRPALLFLEILGLIGEKTSKRYDLQWVPTVCKYGRSFLWENVLQYLAKSPHGLVEVMTHPGDPSEEYIKTTQTPLKHKLQMQELMRPDLKDITDKSGFKIVSYKDLL